MEFIKSSTGSGDIAATVKGFGILIVPLVIAIAKNNGVELAETTVVDIINQIAFFVGSAVALFGLARKLYFAIKK